MGTVMDEALAPAFRRLFDAKAHWHKAIGSYFEPNDFRMAVNSCIQELRNVTFVLQANKSEIAGFDLWYEPWQEKMRANDSLRWLVGARNYIVKRGDLELLSKLRIEVVGSYLEGEVAIFEENYNPNLTNAEIYARTISMGLPSEVFENSYVKLQRRWIDKNYPDYELGELLSECWSAVSELLLDAPSSIESEKSKFNGQKLPPCMHQHLEMKNMLMKVCGETLVPTVLGSESVPVDVERRQSIEERYRDTPMFKSRDDSIRFSSMTFKEQCDFLFQQAKSVLKRDGYHIHLAMLFVQGELAKLIEIRNEDQADKYITTRDLASKIERIGGDAVIIISEAWSALFDPDNPYRGAGDMPDRREILMLIGVTKKNENYCFSVPILREGDAILFGKQSVADATNVNLIQPILSVWERQKRDIPDIES